MRKTNFYQYTTTFLRKKDSQPKKHERKARKNLIYHEESSRKPCGKTCFSNTYVV